MNALLPTCELKRASFLPCLAFFSSDLKAILLHISRFFLEKHSLEASLHNYFPYKYLNHTTLLFSVRFFGIFDLPSTDANY